MTPREKLVKLLESSDENRGDFARISIGQVGQGRKPTHFKRLSVPQEEADRLANLGAYEMIAHWDNVRLFYTQALIAGAILSGEFDKLIIVTPSQYGKLIADDEPVLTRHGWKKHGDLRIGDEVVSPNGDFVPVIYVHPKQMADREVVFANGDRIKCHHNHEWVYSSTTGRRREKCLKTISTAEMERRGLTLPDGAAKYRMPVRMPLVGEHKKLAVNPYVMGAWLGDGSTTKGQICSAKDDIAVLDKCREYYPDGSEWVHKDTGVITRSFKGLADDMSEYGLCYEEHKEEKRIPDEYFTASIEQRMELLAGLIDTDGYQYREDGRYYFVTSGRQLKEDFEALISTFGWKVSTVEHQPIMSSSGIQGKSVYWTIGFNPTMDIPCVLERKKTTRKAKQKGLGIVAIHEIEPVQGNCITVEGGLYCVGRHMIPTHNSWLLGHIAFLHAYNGHRVNLVASTGDRSNVIMSYVARAASESNQEVKNALAGDMMKKIDRLDRSLSQSRISFAQGGSVEAFSLGDTFDDLAHNKAIGRGGAYIVDEAALISDEALSEIGRSEFSSVDGTKEVVCMISNPHKVGSFYDSLTQDDVPDRTLIIWADILTAVQEGRWSKEHALTSEFANHVDTLERYLLCELPTEGVGMFDTAKVVERAPRPHDIHVLGVDAAYKGKDDIYITDTVFTEYGVHFNDILRVRKTRWVDGVTSKDIADSIARIYHTLDAALVCVDVGFGVWLIEALALRGVMVRGVNFAAGTTPERKKARHYSAVNGANLRAEMHLDLQDLMDNQKCTFAPSVWKEIKETLPHVTSERKASGKIIVRPKIEIKNEIGHSPDAFDSVLLSLHAAVLYTEDNAVFIA